ncbi:hypothetical protein Agabi119p4_8663 [Agaricus bisporus var. burnettii]|uniref:amidase n=1 Tax=Agaricus bisporus var. burnettii TaxID=192524 RepID=A0A8H7EXX0_AGABI|nr:hypothetical protein Agabi119p4_8663 [Agaricus bisporus var. burnettii]
MTSQTQDWRSRAKAKKQQQLDSIPKEWILRNPPNKDQLNVTDIPRTCGLLSSREIEITESHVEAILSNLAKGIWSAVEVTTAFSKRAVIAHQLVNCLTEIFIGRGLARAAELDDYFKRTGKVVGPLHGLPISLKDQLCVKGLDATMGYVAWIDKPSQKNSVLVDTLESLGAVFYVKTNIPQTLMFPETYNHIFGRTVNPANRALTSGGSSGGEGALVALRGSPLGVGSDIGGSIRIPAGLNGLYGMRPSYHRTPYAGNVNSLEGLNSVYSVLGPLTTSLETVKTFMSSVISKEPWQYDPLVIRKKWNEDEYRLCDHNGGKQLCFAILWDDGMVRPHPPVLRALETARGALTRAGHKVIDWDPAGLAEVNNVASKLWGSVGKQDSLAVTSLSGEHLITTMRPEVEDLENLFELPSRYKALNLTAFEFWQVNVLQRQLRQEYLDRWRETANVTGTGRPVDAIIAPVAPYAAMPHGQHRNAVYTTVWNILDYPAIAIPVTTVDPILDVKRERSSFYNEDDRTNWEYYGPEKFKDAPVGIQVVGRTLQEEALIGMTEIVDRSLKTYQPKL